MAEALAFPLVDIACWVNFSPMGPMGWDVDGCGFGARN
jgi:hypothetical protein